MSRVMTRMNGWLRGLMALAVAALVGTAIFSADARAEEKMKVAAIFSTPIEEPWVNQVHVALLKAQKELGIDARELWL